MRGRTTNGNPPVPSPFESGSGALAGPRVPAAEYFEDSLLSTAPALPCMANRSLEQEIEVRKRTESELKAREMELEEIRKNLEEMNTALRRSRWRTSSRRERAPRRSPPS